MEVSQFQMTHKINTVEKGENNGYQHFPLFPPSAFYPFEYQFICGLQFF